MSDMINIGARSKQAQRTLATAGGAVIDKALNAIAAALEKNANYILEENSKDIRAAAENDMAQAMIDRLTLTHDRISGMAQGMRQVASSENPVGKVLWGETRPNGLKIEKVAVPIGVIAVIFEARPNVTADAAAICLKAGNSVILKGGKEAINSNKAIAAVMRNALAESGLPEDCIILIDNISRQAATELMKLNGYVDLLIPRGGAGLIRSVVENATVPVIETGVGNCHIYVDADADIEMAADIVANAKASRVSVCNACESLLIHKDIAEEALLIIGERLKEKNVEIRGDEAVCEILPYAVPATEEDWDTEYLDYIISVKTVTDIDEAIAHIACHSTGHSEAIVTDSYAAAEKFKSEVDSAAVYVNASTRFTDGGEFGFGAEIGISTQKLHARGPLGIAHMVSSKYVISGNGQIR
ncbi:MAG: glutamate-5-semialdehyde dehydrogenase [Clostridia bacterium]|nr:glutamate-5-semialdehyde dehydrogenase [Clostridia bacterium]MBQ3006462.1 glutamate-5-semialdehyde dehydrogenase [Clostridia bacterium]